MEDQTSDQPQDHTRTIELRMSRPLPLADRRRLLRQPKPDAPKDTVFTDWASI